VVLAVLVVSVLAATVAEAITLYPCRWTTLSAWI